MCTAERSTGIHTGSGHRVEQERRDAAFAQQLNEAIDNIEKNPILQKSRKFLYTASSPHI